MALNYPGPYEVRINYQISGLQHVMRLNCRIAGDPQPGDPMTGIQVLRRDNSNFTLSNEINDWVNLLKPYYNTAATDFQSAELWKYEPESFNADFVSTMNLSTGGSSASANVLASQLMFTFRTQLGGIMKISLMENITTPAASVFPPYVGAALALSNALVNGTSPWMARDGSYPFANIGQHPGQNEKLFKERYR